MNKGISWTKPRACRMIELPFSYVLSPGLHLYFCHSLFHNLKVCWQTTGVPWWCILFLQFLGLHHLIPFLSLPPRTLRTAQFETTVNKKHTTVAAFNVLQDQHHIFLLLNFRRVFLASKIYKPVFSGILNLCKFPLPIRMAWKCVLVCKKLLPKFIFIFKIDKAFLTKHFPVCIFVSLEYN